MYKTIYTPKTELQNTPHGLKRYHTFEEEFDTEEECQEFIEEFIIEYEPDYTIEVAEEERDLTAEEEFWDECDAAYDLINDY